MTRSLANGFKILLFLILVGTNVAFGAATSNENPAVVKGHSQNFSFISITKSIVSQLVRFPSWLSSWVTSGREDCSLPHPVVNDKPFQFLCPELSGDYVCKMGEERFDLKIDFHHQESGKIFASFSSSRPDISLGFKNVEEYLHSINPTKDCRTEKEEDGSESAFLIARRAPPPEASALRQAIQFSVQTAHPDILTLKFMPIRMAQEAQDQGLPIFPEKSAHCEKGKMSSKSQQDDHLPLEIKPSQFNLNMLESLTSDEPLSSTHCPDTATTPQFIKKLLKKWKSISYSEDFVDLRESLESNVEDHLRGTSEEEEIHFLPICNKDKQVVSLGVSKSSNFDELDFVLSPYPGKGAGRAVLVEILRQCLLQPGCNDVVLYPVADAVGYYFKIGLPYDLSTNSFRLGTFKLLEKFPEFRKAYIGN